MKRILIAILCVLPIFGFAEWETWEKVCETKILDKCFYINSDQKTQGTHLFAISDDMHNAVKMRYKDGVIDATCIILKSDYSASGVYCLQVFDEDHYLVGEDRVEKVVDHFEGTLEYCAKCSKELFNQIHYYKLILRRA